MFGVLSTALARVATPQYVIVSVEFLLANYPHYAGLTSDAAMVALRDIFRHATIRGLTITEVNPKNDSNGRTVARLVAIVVRE